MIFNSWVFIGFFLVVYAGYLALRRSFRAQNRLLLVASFVFYGYWDWRFLLLLLGTACIDYIVGRLIQGTEDDRRRRTYLAISILSNLSVLGFFKYFNFFAASFQGLLGAFGTVHPWMLEIVLPVGISFYTFQAMSYTIDVYRRVSPAETSLLDFLLFVSFFPQLEAGPIERARRMLPQIKGPRTLRSSQVDAALFLLVWGYFKKVVIADNCALIANQIFNGYERYRGLDLVIGILAFTVQIYCDFSGYTDIARGLAKLLGFELILNFKLPYFARSPADFWRRWHISLSSWLRDYLYVPLGGNRGGRGNTYRNLALTMLLGGLWHGAAWNYVAWGAYHGALLIVYRAMGWEAPAAAASTSVSAGPPRARPLRDAARGAGRIAAMFVLTTIGWVLFRARSLDQIVSMLTRVGLSTSGETRDFATTLVVAAIPLVLMQVYQARRRDTLAFPKLSNWMRVPAYAALLTAVGVFGVRESIEFIYFQF